MPFALKLEKLSLAPITVDVEPVRNILASMILLTKDDDAPGLSNWILNLRRSFTAEQRFHHTLVLIGFYYIVASDNTANSFATHIERIAQTEPNDLRTKLLDTYARVSKEHGRSGPVDWNSILVSADSYVQFLREGFSSDAVDEAIERKAYEYVMDPPAMKALIVEHLQHMWNDLFYAEWERIEPMLTESAKAFQGTDFTKMSPFEAARFITGRDLDDEHWRTALEKAERIRFIPSAHIGPYVTRLPDEKCLTIIFGARQPENASVRIPELERAEIVSRLSALADDTRLQILQMIGANGEMRSQEIMEITQLSQPSVSRYLGQLTATGFLQERRVNGAKAYVLNRDRITKTMQAISVFLLGQEP